MPMPLPKSLYAETARPAVATPPLAGERKVAVAVVGGGFTGLSAALHLAQSGVEAVVLEANEPGWGASGRNGGQVNPGLKWEPEELERVFGADASHAWLAVWLPGTDQWLAIDPTNDQFVDDRYVTVAWGRDYGDVPPLKGVIFTESTSHELTVSVDVTPVPDDDPSLSVA